MGNALDNGYNRWGYTHKTDTNYIKGKKRRVYLHNSTCLYWHQLANKFALLLGVRFGITILNTSATTFGVVNSYLHTIGSSRTVMKSLHGSLVFCMPSMLFIYKLCILLVVEFKHFGAHLWSHQWVIYIPWAMPWQLWNHWTSVWYIACLGYLLCTSFIYCQQFSWNASVNAVGVANWLPTHH